MRVTRKHTGEFKADTLNLIPATCGRERGVLVARGVCVSWAATQAVLGGLVPRYRDSHASEIGASGSLGSKGFPERATLSMALRSLRSAATRASFFGFPRATRPS